MFSHIGSSNIPEVLYKLGLDSPPEWFNIGYFPLSSRFKKQYASSEELNDLYAIETWQEAFIWDKKVLSKDQFINRIQIIIQEFLMLNGISSEDCEALLKIFSPYLSKTLIINFKDLIIDKSIIDQHFVLNPELLAKLLALQIPFPKKELIHVPIGKNLSEPLTVINFWEYNRVLQVKTEYLLKHDPVILVVIVRQDIKLGKGKFGTQVAHGVISSIYQTNIYTQYLTLYKNTTYPIIDLYLSPSLSQIEEIDIYAKKIHLNSSLIADAGHTQVPAGTKTVLALGPAPRFYLKTFLSFWNDIKPII